MMKLPATSPRNATLPDATQDSYAVAAAASESPLLGDSDIRYPSSPPAVSVEPLQAALTRAKEMREYCRKLKSFQAKMYRQ